MVIITRRFGSFNFDLICSIIWGLMGVHEKTIEKKLKKFE